MRRTVLLWVVLIVLFVAFYKAFAKGDVAPHFELDSSWLTFAIMAPIAIGILIWGRHLRSVNQVLNEGAELVAKGRLSESLEKFEAFRKRSRNARGPYNIGIVRMRLWQLDEALVEVDRAVKAGDRVPVIKLGGPVTLAMLHALKGDTRAAAEWLTKIDPRYSDGGAALLAQGILACRGGDFEKARTVLGRHEVKQLGGFNAALAAALGAWSIEQTQREVRHVDRIALFGETGPERLRAVWPELSAFIERAPAA